MSKAVKIPADILKEIEGLPSRSWQANTIKFTPEQDAILIHMMSTKTYTATYKWWKEKYGWGGKESLKKRYVKLMEAKDASN